MYYFGFLHDFISWRAWFIVPFRAAADWLTEVDCSFDFDLPWMFSNKYCSLRDKINPILGKTSVVDPSVRGKKICRTGTILPYLCLLVLTCACFNTSALTNLSRYANVVRNLKDPLRMFIQTFQSDMLFSKYLTPKFPLDKFLLLIKFQKVSWQTLPRHKN